MFTAQKKENELPVALVTGAAGFIGSFLCELLLQQHCQVVGIDQLSFNPKKNLKKCLAHPHFTFLKNDLGKKLPIDFARLDYIFHLEGPVDFLLSLASKHHAKILIAGSLANDFVLENLLSPDLDLRVVRIGEVYGPRMTLDSDQPLNRLLKEAIKGRRLSIPDNESFSLQPTYVSDVIYGLLQAMLTPGTQGQVFNLAHPEKYSFLSLARLLQQQAGQDLKLIYVPAGQVKTSQPLPSPTKKLGWRPKISFPDGLKTTWQFFLVGPKAPVSLKVFPKKRWRSIFLLALLLFFSPFFYFFSQTFWGFHHWQKAKTAFFQGDFLQAQEAALTAQKSWQKANDLLAQKTLLFASRTAAGLASAAQAAQTAGEVVHLVLQSLPENKDHLEKTEEKIKALAAELDQSYYLLGLLEADFVSVNQEKIWQILGMEAELELMSDWLPKLRQAILTARQVLPSLPVLLGFDQKHTYLVLLQNNMELRPTGGFIGSFGLLTFDHGRLLDFEVKDVYSADGQLKGHVEPPAALKKYLGEAGWYLRDANWSPDFPTSAQQTSWFLNKETGHLVDGVIGLNLNFVQKILVALGGIKVVDFQEEITADNLFERAEYYAETNFFPGSTQKQDFLGALSRAVFLRLKETDPGLFINLGQAIYQSLAAKDLLIFVDQPAWSADFAAWDGHLRSFSCGPDCLADYLMIVEANVGVNKANFFVRRQLAHQITITAAGEIQATLAMVYQNQSQAAIFPGGDYKNYLRLFLPAKTKLKEIMVGDLIIDQAEIDQEELPDKTVFGFLVTVPVQSEKKVKVTYQLDEKFDFAKTKQYQLLVQKQPGIEDENFPLSFNLPKGVVLATSQPEASTTNLGYFLALPFNQDLFFLLELTQ